MSQPPSVTSPPSAAPKTDSEHPFRYTAQLADVIERRWQAHWEAQGTFRVPNPGTDGFDASRPKFYCLDMFPYPSGAGLHVGHPEGYTATDIVCRYQRMKGRNVLHPMGWDAFGLPAEQYAIQTGVHPALTTKKSIDTFRRQLKRFGFSYDWSRELATIDEDYYGWTQWIWLRCYGAWYDHDEQRARPIEELIEDLQHGRRRVGPSGEVLDAGAGGGTRAWQDLSPDEQSAVIDGRRLAYLGEQTVNWCPKLGTVLANEEVIDGRSERGGFPVHRKPLKQWMFRITAYAERLLRDLDDVQWPPSTYVQQREWIGRSEGADIDFPLLDRDGAPDGFIRVYTTRPDTIFGATYMVLAPEHPLVDEILARPRPETDVEALRAYVRAARDRSDVERVSESKEKTGVFTGAWARNPATGQRIGVWVADYVLMGYGHGAIMAVPAGDLRDWAFSLVFGTPIRMVVAPPPGYAPSAEEAALTAEIDGREQRPFVGAGTAVNSANDEVSLDGLPTAEAKERIIAWLEQRGIGRRMVNYKLRDWLFSRQRYWGEPFPIVYDEEGRHHPVDPAHLPVRLPDLDDYTPHESDDPTPLLANATDWVRTTAGEAGVSPDVLPPDTPVTRETNTMPGWAGSCWYYLRFCDPDNDRRFVSREAERYWMDGGVDLYIGGAEHAVLHLLYARFWHKMLFDLGEVSTPEPFARLFHQGMITALAYQREDKSLLSTEEVEQREDGVLVEKATGHPVAQIGAKMSKSLKNVVNPDEIIAEFGADTFRLYEMYMGPLEASKPWNTRDTIGLFRFLQRAWRLAVDEATGELTLRAEADASVEKQLHRTIARVAEDIERLTLNTAIAALIEFVNCAHRGGGLARDQLERFVLILGPFAPHLAEELWSKLGHDESLAQQPWPAFDEAMLRDEHVELPVQISGKLRGRVTVPSDADRAQIEQIVLADERVTAHLEGKTVRKVIVVPGKIVNVIAG